MNFFFTNLTFVENSVSPNEKKKKNIIIARGCSDMTVNYWERKCFPLGWKGKAGEVNIIAILASYRYSNYAELLAVFLILLFQSTITFRALKKSGCNTSFSEMRFFVFFIISALYWCSAELIIIQCCSLQIKKKSCLPDFFNFKAQHFVLVVQLIPRGRSHAKSSVPKRSSPPSEHPNPPRQK